MQEQMPVAVELQATSVAIWFLTGACVRLIEVVLPPPLHSLLRKIANMVP